MVDYSDFMLPATIPFGGRTGEGHQNGITRLSARSSTEEGKTSDA